MGRAKGSNMVHMRAWVKTQRGPEAWRRVLDRLNRADRAVVEKVVAVGWYDVALQHRLLRTIDEELGSGDLALVPEIGRFEADRDLTTVQRVLLRFANPAFVLEKAGEYWRRFYDHGRWQVERLGRTGARGTLEGFEELDGAFCLYLQSYIARMFELVGAKDVEVHHVRCRARGDDACVFAGTWRR